MPKYRVKGTIKTTIEIDHTTIAKNPNDAINSIYFHYPDLERMDLTATEIKEE
ncbi:MAG TPA: hypothetical protein VN704_04815 [Verrucomicrobiae bacterium]|nr:hypothetical protein [Verrucomicrobiae bacterium]